MLGMYGAGQILRGCSNIVIIPIVSKVSYRDCVLDYKVACWLLNKVRETILLVFHLVSTKHGFKQSSWSPLFCLVPLTLRVSTQMFPLPGSSSPPPSSWDPDSVWHSLYSTSPKSQSFYACSDSCFPWLPLQEVPSMSVYLGILTALAHVVIARNQYRFLE